jgi:glycosyltransferase involved in cell wall biosynthesis
MKTLAVIRGMSPRIAQAQFFANFKKAKIKFVGHHLGPDFAKIKAQTSLELTDLPLKPFYGIDPLFFLPVLHRRWLGLANLEPAIKGADVVNTYESFHFYSRQVVELGQKLKIPSTCIVWSTSINHPARFIWPYSQNYKTVLKSCDLFIARSKRAGRMLRRFGVEDKRIQVVYSGVDLSLFQPAPKKERKTTILYVGALEESKGVNHLIQSFLTLLQTEKNIKLLICGRGGLEKEVKTQAKNYPQIEYLGFVPYLNLPKIYQKADIFCSPSLDRRYLGLFRVEGEYFSYVLMEAMATGLPIVATRCGGIPEEIGGENLLVKQGRVEELTRALKELLKDKDLRKSLGRKNRLRAEKLFNIEIQARKTEEAILKLV